MMRREIEKVGEVEREIEEKMGEEDDKEYDRRYLHGGGQFDAPFIFFILFFIFCYKQKQKFKTISVHFKHQRLKTSLLKP